MADEADVRAIFARLDYIEEFLGHLGRVAGYAYTPYRLVAGEADLGPSLGVPSAPFSGTGAPGTGGPVVPTDIVAMARGGKMVQAIKQYRDMTGLRLGDAKNAVEQAVARGY